MHECCLYYRGELPSGELSRILSAAEKRGLRVSETLRDEPPAVSSFRRLQDYIKLGLCRRAIFPSYEHLGDDEWLRLENELFLKRNGVRTIFARAHTPDCLERFANAVKRYCSPANEWELRYGEMLPPPPARTGEKALPFGYMSEDGEAVVSEPEAGTVRLVFGLYAEGLTLQSIAQRTKIDIRRVRKILYCGRYLGEPDDAGGALPGIISRAQWFAALDRRREREQNEHASPYFRADKALDEATRKRIEAAAEDAVSMLVKGEAMVAFAQAANRRRGSAEAAAETAGKELARAEEELASLLREIELGRAESSCDKELSRLRDACFTASLRRRRAETEAELYSLTDEQTERFFGRAANVKRLCRDERAFMVSSLLISAKASENGFELSFASPGGLVKRTVR